uniref:Uncharacterized protein n=1 Tax=Vespula pensylvanica TaxID=30213 RepID=A0A834PEZ1_VESPE|nr:hypothetical protein H0235_000706 [Vespula pensylvanica]
MDESDLQLAKAMASLEVEENTPSKTVVSRMQDKQQTFRNRIKCDGGVMVSIVAFQAVDPGSIPGHRT